MKAGLTRNFAVFVSSVVLFSGPVCAEDVKQAPEAAKAPHETSEMGHAKKRGMFDMSDVNGDGMLTKEEFMTVHEKRFVEMDLNGDGQVSREEANKKREEMRAKMKERREKMQAERMEKSSENEGGHSEGSEEEKKAD